MEWPQGYMEFAKPEDKQSLANQDVKPRPSPTTPTTEDYWHARYTQLEKQHDALKRKLEAILYIAER